MARNFLYSGALDLLGMRPATSITVVSPNPDDRTVVLQAGATWVPYFHPRRWRGEGEPLWAGDVLRWSRYLRYLAGLALHMRTLIDGLVSQSEEQTRILLKSRDTIWSRLKAGLAYFLVNSVDYTIGRRIKFRLIRNS